MEAARRSCLSESEVVPEAAPRFWGFGDQIESFESDEEELGRLHDRYLDWGA